MQKFKAGDKVRIVKYGHLLHHFGENAVNNWFNNIKKFHKDFQTNLVWGVESDVPLENEDYSHLLLEGFDTPTTDSSLEIVGKEGIIQGSYFDLYGGKEERNKKIYSIKGIPEKTAWYDEAQLELI